jgi:PTH1 family peptidyl-tRNA hydrolase
LIEEYSRMNGSDNAPWIVVGLGNPGTEYISTRHNIGFRCVEHLAERNGIALSEKRRHALLGKGFFKDLPIVVAKPKTFMNSSGEAVRYLIQRFGSPQKKILIISDDMDLPIGQLRIRMAGGSGGHRGLDSIIEQLGNDGFSRLRVGVGRPMNEALNHVLGDFSEREEETLSSSITLCAEAIESWLTEGIERTMNRFNGMPGKLG